jgi:tetrapyrrole methylase family protein/MazG family protein
LAGKSVEELFTEYIAIIRRLRKECPWDRSQTHESLRSPLLEETYEVLDAISANDRAHLRNELGDLILLIVLQVIIGEEEGSFTLSEVLLHSKEKLIRRHPHVFGHTTVKNDLEVRKNWESIKRQEGKTSILDGVPDELPALIRAQRIQEKASTVGFDWENKADVWKKVKEELGELATAEENGDMTRIEQEFGDLLFALVNYARFIKVNSEFALRQTVNTCGKRFEFIEQQLKARGESPTESTLAEMDQLWNEAKKNLEK